MIVKAFNTTAKGFINLEKFKFSSQIKIYEGLVLSEKLKYTLEDNFEYRKLCFGNSEENQKYQLKQTQYVDRMLLASIFSRIIGSNLSLSIYLSQKIDILKDLPLGREIEGQVTVAKNLGKDRYLLSTEVLGKEQNGQIIKYVTGQAKIIFRE